MTTNKKQIIGLFGFGVVGESLYHVINNSPASNAFVKKICIKDDQKPRSLPAEAFYTDPEDIISDPEINLFVELINEPEDALEIVKAALLAGKSVVSGNKKMLAMNLKTLVELQQQTGNALSANGAIGIFEAYSDNQHIVVLHDQKKHLLYMPEKHKNGLMGYPFTCFTDYICQKDSGQKDYAGVFVLSAGFGAKEMAESYRAKDDDFSALLKGNYQGIRPAPGYPGWTDHSAKQTLLQLVDPRQQTGIGLTETFSLIPSPRPQACIYGHQKSKNNRKNESYRSHPKRQSQAILRDPAPGKGRQHRNHLSDAG